MHSGVVVFGNDVVVAAQPPLPTFVRGPVSWSWPSSFSVAPSSPGRRAGAAGAAAPPRRGAAVDDKPVEFVAVVGDGAEVTAVRSMRVPSSSAAGLGDDRAAAVHRRRKREARRRRRAEGRRSVSATASRSS
jgi:hypothetical protein